MSKPAVLAEPILVGREKELEELQSLLNSVIEGKGKTVFVSGEAGSGKTRLTREFLRAAVGQGVAVMAGWCLSDSQVPYFPFMEAFNSYYAASGEEEAQSSLLQSQAQLGLGTPVRVGLMGGEGEITSWLTGARQAGKPVMLSAQAWKDQVFAAVSETLHTVAVQGPLVLFLEDVHWADSASLALLHYIARAIHGSERVLLLATFRSEELTADVEGHPHPLAETLRLMSREELFTDIKLSTLDKDNVTRIAESMMGGRLQPELAGKLTSEGRGNPLFVVESLRMLYERKSLIQENNEWRLTLDELGIPNKIKDIILRRLACLKYAQRRVLDAASVIGEEFDVDLLSTVLGEDSLDVLETLNVIAHSTSLVQVEENRYRFDHARSRETLYEELSSPLKRGYHNRIAEKLESTAGSKQPFSDLAYHYAQAGNKEKAVKNAFAAGQEALERFSNQEAIKHFTYILQTIGKGPDCADQRERALEGLADALLASNRVKESMKMYEDLFEKAVTDVVKLRALRKAMEASWLFGDCAHLMDLVKKAEPYVSSDRLENARVLMSRGRVYTMQFMLSKADEYYRAALQVFEEEYSLWDTAYALIGTGLFRGLADSLRSISIFDELGDFRWEMEAAIGAHCAFTWYWLNQETEADQLCLKIIELEDTLKMGDYYRLTFAYVYLSWLPMIVGDFEKALSYALKGLEASKKTESLSIQSLVYGRLAILYSALGDLETAQGYLEKAMEIPPECRGLAFMELPLAQMVFCASKGQFNELENYYNEALKVVGSDNPGLKSLYAWALNEQGRLGEAQALRGQVHAAYKEAQEKFAHATVQGNLMVRRHVIAGEEVEMRVDLVNVARSPGKLVKIDGVVFPDFFIVTSFPNWCSLEEGTLGFKEKTIGPFKVETAKLKLKVNKPGSYNLTPAVTYKDEFGNAKTSKINQFTINVQPAKPTYEALPGRVTTGTVDLDELLLGGIPEKYAVVLSAPSSDERQQLIKRFVETGPLNGQTTIYLTCEASSVEQLAQAFPANFYVCVCNPQADILFPNLENIVKLKGTENLTEIDIALTKLLRTINLSQDQPRRVCVDLVSDVLLQHHAVTTRKWLSGLIAILKAKGYSTLAVVDPVIAPEEVPAIVSLFDGEIRVTEAQNEKGIRKTLQVTKLINQRYVENEVVLTKENMQGS